MAFIFIIAIIIDKIRIFCFNRIWNILEKKDK